MRVATRAAIEVEDCRSGDGFAKVKTGFNLPQRLFRPTRFDLSRKRRTQRSHPYE